MLGPRQKRGLPMKILAPLMLALVVSIFLTSCGREEDCTERNAEESSAEGTSTEVATTEETSVRAEPPDPATVGSPLTFVVVVTNNSFPQHVGFKDFLPPGVTFVSATPGQGFCGPPHHSGNLFDCTLDTISTGGRSLSSSSRFLQHRGR
jgi:uncharacterized repeat protein (TIGR01451 family)